MVTYEISQAPFSAKTSLDKTVKFWWTSIISASLSTVCKIYKNSLKLCGGPLVTIIILLSVCSVSSGGGTLGISGWGGAAGTLEPLA